MNSIPAAASQATGVPPTKPAAGAGPEGGGLAPSGPSPNAQASKGAAIPASGWALADVIALRRDQITRHGHTLAADQALPLDHFARELVEFARAASEYLHFNRRPIARRKLVKLAAFTLAAIDRLDNDPATAEQEDA